MTAAALTVVPRLLAPAEVSQTLLKCWVGDFELTEKFHRRAPCLLVAAVSDTVAVLRTAEDGEVFALETPDRDTVGIIGFDRGRSYLTTFGLAMGYRTPEGKALFWDAFNELTNGNAVLVAVYDRNTRAARFLEANGAEREQDFTCPETQQPATLYTL